MLRYRYPELAAALRAADEGRQRAAARAACDVARAATGLSGREVDRAMSALGQGRFGETQERVMMRDLADRLELEAGEPTGELWLRACAARALAWALHQQAARAAEESIYLAIVALDEDVAAVEPVVRGALEDPTQPAR